MTKFSYLVIILIASQFATSQETYSSNSIPSELLENANAVIRKNDVQITIEDYDKVEIVTNRIVTVLNKKGLGDIKAGESYDDDTNIKSIEASIYDDKGKKISRIKSKDFNDVSAVSNGTLYSDNRVKYLDFTPRSYPFTVHFESKVVYNSTAFMPAWVPIEYFYASTQSSTFKVINETNVEVKFKESNLEGYSGINKKGLLSYEAQNLEAIVPQAYSPDFSTYGPMVRIALKDFSMKGVQGSNENWLDFGKWMNESLLIDVGELPEEVIIEIKSLTKDAKTQKEKAKIVYEFMQERSRYISVQVGIGGWKPTEAEKVHEVAYGDCKGLSNYTKALLNEVGITSYHAIIYGDRSIRNIDKDFSATQGNHMILYVPELDDEKDIWLECTSKTNPFGYLAGWTDDRDALVITEDGGKILHTTVYPTSQNKQNVTAQVNLSADGMATAQVTMETSGFQYQLRDFLQSKTDKERNIQYKQFWDHINGLKITNSTFKNDKEQSVFSEVLEIIAPKYASKSGSLLLFEPVMFSRNSYVPAKYEERNYDLKIDRGYVDFDQYTIVLDPQLTVDALPNKVSLETKFGSYLLEVNELEGNQLEVKRKLQINNGLFSKEDYKDYRNFLDEVAKHDKSKSVLKVGK
ncbi:DUF3857 domain-containing protein [Nonlabens dokdonensis]|nr:DUF3857 domain-containing protein [Nonlabens dokdonensis]